MPFCAWAFASTGLGREAHNNKGSWMSTSGSQPDGGEIERLLREAGSAYDPPALDALIEGVLAAPAEVGTSWHMLVADPVTPALADALEARRATRAKEYRNGLATEDF